MEQNSLFLRHEVGASNKNAARRIKQRLGAGNSHGHLQRVLQFLRITCRVIVQDHQIEFQAFRSQILMGAQHLPGHLDIFFAVQSQNYNWYVAADSLGPET